jgi:hypothetical protein
MQKEMSVKFGHFAEEKLEKHHFSSNAAGHRTIQNMVGKYEQMYARV